MINKMKCKNCGFILKKDENFCRKCGNPNSIRENDLSISSAKYSKKKIFIYIAVIAIILVVGIFIININKEDAQKYLDESYSMTASDVCLEETGENTDEAIAQADESQINYLYGEIPLPGGSVAYEKLRDTYNDEVYRMSVGEDFARSYIDEVKVLLSDIKFYDESGEWNESISSSFLLLKGSYEDKTIIVSYYWCTMYVIIADGLIDPMRDIETDGFEPLGFETPSMAYDISDFMFYDCGPSYSTIKDKDYGKIIGKIPTLRSIVGGRFIESSYVFNVYSTDQALGHTYERKRTSYWVPYLTDCSDAMENSSEEDAFMYIAALRFLEGFEVIEYESGVSGHAYLRKDAENTEDWLLVEIFWRKSEIRMNLSNPSKKIMKFGFPK